MASMTAKQVNQQESPPEKDSTLSYQIREHPTGHSDIVETVNANK